LIENIYNLFDGEVEKPIIVAVLCGVAALFIYTFFYRIFVVNRDNNMDEKQKKCLALGAIYFVPKGTLKAGLDKFKMPVTTVVFGKSAFHKMWGISDATEAKNILDNLSVAEQHTPFCDPIYNAFILKGKKSVEKSELFGTRSMNQAINIIAQNIGLGFASTEEEQDIVTKDVNYSLSCFWAAYENLIKLGYTKEELAKIKTTSAWDLIRTPMVARMVATHNLGYISMGQAWAYMYKSEEHARNLYSSWRECLAAFVFGRALGFHDDSESFKDTLDFLLNDKDSPYKSISF
jgi:hypothetical protein